ncbi:hypothetical protein [Paenibacillus wulumuqiensis]|uniref:hypothetical protein n=1 Tax=Paenibacillus wulumuqiensis TaxID=1567107 RepID=UPI0006193EC3|nr:hypothetical protein [Paenibacillus wulumuqiensis]
MKTLRKFILAFLLANVIGNFSFRRLSFLQYDMAAGWFTLENGIKYLISLACYIAVAVWIYQILEGLEKWREENKSR